MVAGHSNIKRIVHRIGEECRSTAEIARLTSWPEALETFRAKIDIQVMNRNGYRETPAIRKRLIRKHKTIMTYFEKRYGTFANGYKYSGDSNPVPEHLDGCIWVCWWQGLNDAPAIVKRCIESLKRHAGSHKVVVLTEDNYRDYVTFPDWIMHKHDEGIITRTHLSDLLRFSLLARYGGLWLDSTFFCVDSLDETAFSCPLWSIKRPDYFHASVAQGYFANYSFACRADMRWVFAVIRDYLLEYWRTNDSMVDYLFVDYLIALAIRHNKRMREAFSEIPPNNPRCDDLYKVLGDRYDKQTWRGLIWRTSLFKLTWKQSFPTEANGEKTFYGKLIDGSL